MKNAAGPAGKFLTLEGGEGSGKSTQALFLKSFLEGRGLEVVMTREPGGTPTGEMIRDMLQHHTTGEDIAPIAEVMLFAASRAQHIRNVIRPALCAGKWVICDRFVDSSMAYQAGGRGIDPEKVLKVNEVALDGCWPDVTFWFDLSPEEALDRMKGRGEQPDRFESEEREFHRSVHAMYRRLHRKFPDRIHRIQAELPPERVSAELRKTLENLPGGVPWR